jgi:hypothetical protein
MLSQGMVDAIDYTDPGSWLPHYLTCDDFLKWMSCQHNQRPLPQALRRKLLQAKADALGQKSGKETPDERDAISGRHV